VPCRKRGIPDPRRVRKVNEVNSQGGAEAKEKSSPIFRTGDGSKKKDWHHAANISPQAMGRHCKETARPSGLKEKTRYSESRRGGGKGGDGSASWGSPQSRKKERKAQKNLGGVKKRMLAEKKPIGGKKLMAHRKDGNKSETPKRPTRHRKFYGK